MWSATSEAHTHSMNTTWYQTPDLVAEHRAALEGAARRHRATRSLRRIWRRTKALQELRAVLRPAVHSLKQLLSDFHTDGAAESALVQIARFCPEASSGRLA